MLSLCFENDFDDVVRSNGSSRELLSLHADLMDIDRQFLDAQMSKKNENGTLASPDVAAEFYNGLGKKFGYSIPENMRHNLNNTTNVDSYGSQPNQIISPWTMSNEDKEDLIKNGSDVDKFWRTQPRYVGPEGPPIIPQEYSEQKENPFHSPDLKDDVNNIYDRAKEAHNNIQPNQDDPSFADLAMAESTTIDRDTANLIYNYGKSELQKDIFAFGKKYVV